MATDILPLQPYPLLTRVCHLEMGDGVVTAIGRTWEDGDPARCRLCTKCEAVQNACLLMVDFFVPRSSAPLFSLAAAYAGSWPVEVAPPRLGESKG